MYRTRIPTRVYDLKFNVKRYMRQPRTLWFSWVLNFSKKKGKRWKKIDNKDCGKNDDTVTSINQYKNKTLVDRVNEMLRKIFPCFYHMC
jgi:hypothetical protein